MLKQFFCDAQGFFDDARVNASLLVLTYIGCSVYAIHQGQLWTPKDFGIGAGALAAGIGAWFGFRKDN